MLVGHKINWTQSEMPTAPRSTQSRIESLAPNSIEIPLWFSLKKPRETRPGGGKRPTWSSRVAAKR